MVFVLQKFIENPLGYGFGSFPKYYHGVAYPHNVIMEAMFELGLFGVLPVLGMVFLSVLWFVRDVFKKGFRLFNLMLFVSLCYVLKCGSFVSMAPWLLSLYFLAADDTPHPPPPSRHTNRVGLARLNPCQKIAGSFKRNDDLL